MTSMNITSLATTATRTSPGPGTGSGTSAGIRTSGPPKRPASMACIPSRSYGPVGADGAVRAGAVGGDVAGVQTRALRVDIEGDHASWTDPDDLSGEMRVRGCGRVR